MPRPAKVVVATAAAAKPAAKKKKKVRVTRSELEGDDVKYLVMPKRPSVKSRYGTFGNVLSGYGAKIGNKIGSLADLYLNKIFGQGAYRVNRNSLSNRDQIPAMHSLKDGFRIRHREYISDISSSVAFSNTTYDVNPGLGTTFPWLSALAQNFEEYSIEGMVVEFKSTSADALNSVNTALGTVVLTAEYNSAQAAYVNKQQMENSMFAVSTKPSVSVFMPIECDKRQNPMGIQYVRTGDVPAGQDKRMYDLCNFQVATVGSQAVAVVGELWITYDVILRKPQLDSGLALSARSTHLLLASPTGAAPYGSSSSVVYDSIGVTATTTAITLPVGLSGKYLFTWNAIGDSTASLVAPLLTLTNATALSAYGGPALQFNVISNTGTSTTLIRNSIFNITDPSIACVLTLGVAGTLPTNAAGDVMITQLNGNFA